MTPSEYRSRWNKMRSSLLALLLATSVMLSAQTPSSLSSTAGEQPAKTIANSIGMKLARIPAGEFLMGSADADPGAREDEKPQHRVRISKPFYLGVHEVTQAEFQGLMGINPSSFTRAG